MAELSLRSWCLVSMATLRVSCSLYQLLYQPLSDLHAGVGGRRPLDHQSISFPCCAKGLHKVNVQLYGLRPKSSVAAR